MDFRAIDLSEIEQYSPFILAGMAGTTHPNSANTWGAVTLSEFRDELLDAWREGRFERDSDRYDFDVISEVTGATLRADSAPIWDAWHELELWGQGWPDTSEYAEPGTYSFTCTLEDMARQMIEEMLEGLGREIIAEVRKILADWVCPACGDSGYPRVCWPGEPCEHDGHACDEEGCLHEDRAPGAVDTPAPTLVTLSVDASPSVAPGHLADPLSVEPSETQAFMSRMDEINRQEFDKVYRRRNRTPNLIVAGSLAVAVLVIVAYLIIRSV